MKAGLLLSALIWGLVAIAIEGCGYAIVPIPQPGQRVSISSEQRIDSAFETAIDAAETTVDPVSYFRRKRR